MKWLAWTTPCLLACVLTGLNALKPAHVDDFGYLTYAREFAAHPIRPYDFAYGTPFAAPAMETLVPPVLPGWLALGQSFLGDDPLLLKLWLFPFAALFAAAIAALFRRFAPTLAEPLTWLTVLSPGILPSFNFMLEVPVLGLQLTALVLTMKACDEGRWGWLWAAGLLIGLALQTKYSACAALGAMMIWCLQAKRPLFALTLVLVAGGIFAGWEAFVTLQHGESHFLISLDQRDAGLFQRIVRLILPMVANLGGLMPAVTLLGLAALSWSPRALSAVAMFFVAGFFALAFVPEEWARWGGINGGKPFYTLAQTLYGLFGAATCVVLAAVVSRLDRGLIASLFPKRTSIPNADHFLILALLCEIAWYLLITPFPAARRVLGIAIMATLVIARLAVRTSATPPRKSVWAIATFGCALGFAFFAIDLQDARAAQRAAMVAGHGPYQPEPGRAAWSVDLHGFAIACEREGVRSLQFNRTPCRKGDVIFLPDVPFSIRARLKADDHPHLEKIGAISVRDAWPLRAYVNFYSGSAPLRHVEGPRYVVAVYRVTHDFDLSALQSDLAGNQPAK